jgi:quinol monooxygenase YgiN
VITFTTHLRVAPDKTEALEALLAGVRDESRAKEPGVLYYDFARSADEAGVLLVIEVYADAAAHSAHMAAPWVKRSIPQALALVEGPMQIRQYVSPGTTPAIRQMKDDR